MELELSEEQQELQESVRAVLERESPVALARRVVEEGEGAEDLWARMVELDWTALAVPVEDGGLGFGVVELVVVAEQLGRVLSPGPYLATASQYAPAVRAAGSGAQRKRLLGAVAVDGVTGSLAVAESAGSFEVGSVEATATAEGDGWRLDGKKCFVMEAGRVRRLVVAARLAGTVGGDGIALFDVPTDAVTVVPTSALDATRGLATVVLDGVRVGGDDVLGEPGSAGQSLQRALDEATVVLAAEMVGTCQGILEVVLAYAGEREQFGVKIGSFQAVKHKLANMYVAVESARATAYFAAAALDEDDDRVPMAVSMAKAAVADCQKLVAQEGIQCLGGIGYTWEHDMHLYVKRLKTSAALFGTGAEHRARVATLLGL